MQRGYSMARVAVVTDSTACLPKELAQEYDIRVVPLSFIFGDVTYRDDPDMDMAEFYHRLKQEDKTPTTSSASPGAYLEVFKELGQQAEGILCVTVTSRISGMLEAARIAKEMAADVLPNTEVRVLDSGTATMAQGFVALAAARTAKVDEPLDAVLRTAEDVKSRVELVAMVDTLDYLAKSGRFPKVGAWAASLVGLKPILTLKDGHPRPITASRNSRRGMEGMLKFMREKTRGRGPLHVSVIHGDVPQQAEEFRVMIQRDMSCAELLVAHFTPVMGIYTGPGVVGLVFYAEE